MKFDLDDIWMEEMEGLTKLSRLQKRRFYRVIMVLASGISYLIDTALLALFSKAGTIDFTIVSFYGFAAVVYVVVFTAMFASGVGEDSKDPHLVVSQMICAISIQVTSIILAPKLTAFFLGLLFLVFIFGMLRVSLSAALLFWVITSTAILSAMSASVEPKVVLWQPNETEGMLVAISFSMILLRMIVVGYYSTMLRMKMYEKSSHFEDVAIHDSLTGLFNRNVVIPAIKDQIALSQRGNNTSSLAMLDIDDFKSINDQYGHTTGDDVLTTLAQHFSSQVREADMVGRFGGEEFIFLMPMTNVAGAMEIMERIMQGMLDVNWKGLEEGHRITFSCGVTEIKDDDTIDAVLKRADEALYAAKKDGKNRVYQHNKMDCEQTTG